MFEENFPTNGYIDCLDFLKPLENTGYTIDILSLGKLRTISTSALRLGLRTISCQRYLPDSRG